MIANLYRKVQWRQHWTDGKKTLCLDCRQAVIQGHPPVEKTDIEPLLTNTVLKRSYPAVTDEVIEGIQQHEVRRGQHGAYKLYAWRDCYRALYHVYGGEAGLDQQHNLNIKKNDDARSRVVARWDEISTMFKESFGDDYVDDLGEDGMLQCLHMKGTIGNNNVVILFLLGCYWVLDGHHKLIVRNHTYNRKKLVSTI